MFDQLFTEVSVAEQETISGGLLSTGTINLNGASTSFFAQQTNSTSFAQSGPGGSIAGGGNSSTTVSTTGLTVNILTMMPPMPPMPDPDPDPDPNPNPPNPGPVDP
ncbi:CTB family bacteriocin [Nodularia spumigena CS-586/05]|uniref:CTB family bacteriocin n=1 Tax=Nodularia spumigena TaxID=70799 RepID=UPI00232E3254|nr:CTB family bacteriocin [Nodularia spumigena]MDB9343517.1 CTB family bacteriocin [Nodularia spumigena CS-588/06]MDB9370153.1 CTB family bacteriocin [Nodularia spumigena CS-586/05]